MLGRVDLQNHVRESRCTLFALPMGLFLATFQGSKAKWWNLTQVVTRNDETSLALVTLEIIIILYFINFHLNHSFFS